MNEQSPVHEHFIIRQEEGVPLPNPFHAAHRNVNIRRSKSLDDSSVMLGTGMYYYVAFMDDERMEFLLFDLNLIMLLFSAFTVHKSGNFHRQKFFVDDCID